MSVPSELRYTKDHEWVKIEGNQATIGITHYAQESLGDIVYLDIETIGENLSSGEVFGVVEAVKTVADLFMPIDGQVIEFNEELINAPELVNSDPYESGWIIKIQLSAENQESTLLEAEDYRKIIQEG